MKLNHVRAALCLSLLVALALNAAAQDLAPKFDEYLNALTRQNRFSGAVLVAREGKVVFSKGYGTANYDHDIANTPQTKFRIGSVTKQFTAAATLLLQERGKLNVQDSVCKFVDNCPDAWKEITVHHLLTHTSGIPSFTNMPEYAKTHTQPTTMTELLARFKDKPLEFKPGEKFKYNNSGYVLLGHLVEKISGQTYERFLQENIFAPLKMMATGYDLDARVIKGRATGYSALGEKVVVAPFVHMSIPHGAGALYSTVEDLFTWNEALYHDKLLASASRAAMMTVFKDGYAYGLAVNEKFKRQQVAHGGGIEGFTCMLSRFPAEKLTVVVLRNVDAVQPPPGKVAEDLAAIALGEKYEVARERTAIKVEAKVLESYVGAYELTPDFILTITREGEQLYAQATGQPRFELYAESETKFFLKVVDAQATFVRNEQGQVTQMILHQGGDKYAKKIK